MSIFLSVDRDPLPITLVVLAAGMGSRYGGLKQLDPVGPSGEILLDYSVYNAVRAGFSEIVFIIRREIEEPFHKTIGDRYALAFPHLQVRYVFQEITDLPHHIKVPAQRTKPWGTGHALLAARHLLKSPFAVINADDYYGSSGYDLLAAFLRQSQPAHYAMVGYQLKNTLSPFGTVSRGVVESTAEGFLQTITEHTKLQRAADGRITSVGEGETLVFTGEELVSLNFWALLPDVFSNLEKLFEEFLIHAVTTQRTDSLEFYLPSAIHHLIAKGSASVKLIPTLDPWFGLTHPSDLLEVKARLQHIPLTNVFS